jgi:hypothetical protein
MVRISKQQERRNQSPHRRRPPAIKTGTVKDNLSEGYKVHANSVEGDLGQSVFIPKVK